MKIMDYVDRYTYRVQWSDEDEEFVATCAEFPSLSWVDSDRVKALQGILGLVKEVVEEMGHSQEKIPTPFSSKDFSGKFNVRMPRELHRRLAIESAEQNVSLNQYVVTKLAS